MKNFRKNPTVSTEQRILWLAPNVYLQFEKKRNYFNHILNAATDFVQIYFMW